MDSVEERALLALHTMRQWQWQRYDPDGMPLSHSLELSQVVNRLAMSGQVGPHSAVLKLLCQGKLSATGDFRWRKYQWGQHFQLEGISNNIEINQWKSLEDLIYGEEQQLLGDGWPGVSVDLDKLQLPNCAIYKWEFTNNRFSTAQCPPDTQLYHPSYFEEWFSAWDIEIWPDFPDGADQEIELAPPSPTVGKVGRPLAEWWPDFVAELVAYVADSGVPPGIGHQGQSEVIGEIFVRLQERGKAEPSRSQIQEVVNAVLRRMRSAGN